MEQQELQKLVEYTSIKYFDKPFVGHACFNKRLRTTGGRYIPSKRTIEINPKYLTELGEEELFGIIKHELCHYHPHVEGHPYHHRSKYFRALLQKVNAPRFCQVLPSEAEKRNIIYKCVNCNMTYKRKEGLI